MLTDIRTTAKDLHQQLVKKFGPLNYLKVTKSIVSPDGLNILQISIINNRKEFLLLFVHLGWWGELKKSIVSYSDSVYHGKTAKQILQELTEKRKNSDLKSEFDRVDKLNDSISQSPLIKMLIYGENQKALNYIDSKDNMKNLSKKLNFVDANGGNALYWAVVTRNVEIFKSLLQVGVNPAIIMKDGRNLLHTICEHGNSKFLDLMFEFAKQQVNPWLLDLEDESPLDRCEFIVNC